MEIFLVVMFGFEDLLVDEVCDLGYSLQIQFGGVIFIGGWFDVWCVNLCICGVMWVLVCIGSFCVMYLV